MSLKSNLIAALTSEPVKWVNFTHANRGIAPIAFYMLAVAVHEDRVHTKIDRSIQGRIAYYDSGTNTVIASGPDFADTYWDEKALLIHESAHAILDGIYAGKDSSGKPSRMRVVDDEIIGYLAGAFYLVAAKASGASQTAPEREAIKLARAKLLPWKPWSGCEVFSFTATELQPLRSAVANHPAYRSVAQSFAPHDGF